MEFKPHRSGAPPDGTSGVPLTSCSFGIVVSHRRSHCRTAGIDVRLLNLLYLEDFVLTIALGLRYLRQGS